MRTFSQIFKALREERGLTQEQLADALHVTKQAVSHWERGTREPKNRDVYDMKPETRIVTEFPSTVRFFHV